VGHRLDVVVRDQVMRQWEAEGHMETDKSATILEARWMEQEIPRIEAELGELRVEEQELLTSPLETVRRVYMDAYRAERKRSHAFYHHRRSVTPASQGYRERKHEVGWFTILARVLIVLLVVLAVYVAYHNHQLGETQKGIIWGSVLLVAAIGLAFAPALADHIWERRARQVAEAAAQEARLSPAFLQERQNRQARLQQCRARIADLEERLAFARLRLDELRKELTSSNHHGDLLP
jgi:hypothetical protein